MSDKVDCEVFELLIKRGANLRVLVVPLLYFLFTCFVVFFDTINVLI